MAQVHCERFPSCFEIGENNHTPKCKAEGCPGNRTWRDVIPDAFTPVEATHGKPDGAVREALQHALSFIQSHMRYSQSSFDSGEEPSDQFTYDAVPVVMELEAALHSPKIAAAETPLEDNRWITEARATLNRLGAFLQKTGAPHRVDWQEWIDSADKHLGLKWPSEVAAETSPGDAIQLAYGLLWIVGCDRSTTDGNALYLARKALYERINKDGQARGITAARKALADNPFHNLPDPVDTGVFPRTDSGTSDASTRSGASDPVAVVRDDGDTEGRASAVGLTHPEDMVAACANAMAEADTADGPSYATLARACLRAIDRLDVKAEANEAAGYISPRTLKALGTPHGAGAIVAAAGYDTTIPVYTHPTTKPEAPAVSVDAIKHLRHVDVQAIHAGISRRDWHAVETAANTLRDKIDAALIARER